MKLIRVLSILGSSCKPVEDSNQLIKAIELSLLTCISTYMKYCTAEKSTSRRDSLFRLLFALPRGWREKKNESDLEQFILTIILNT